LDGSLRPLICVAGQDECKQLRQLFPPLLVLRRGEGWADNVVLLGVECIRRRQAILRAQRAEQSALASQRYAGLGKYMIEMRHNINNALTSVLGNAELLLLGQETLSEEARDQLETVRNMSLRMHEIMHRFWSLEAELQVTERPTLVKDKETRQKAGGVAAGAQQ
jgi:signal transduction histidine kinase